MLRKKSQRFFKPISRQPFSTSNNLRNQGWVGQTSLSRSIQPVTHKTINGQLSVANGNGGCCGTYPRYDNCGLNICTPVIQTGYKANVCQSCPIVKDFSPLNLSQSQRLLRKKRAYFGRRYFGGTLLNGVPKWSCCAQGGNVYHHIGGKLYTNAPYGKGVFYSQGTGMPSLSQSGYIESKLANTKCMQKIWPERRPYDRVRRCSGCGPTVSLGGKYEFSTIQKAIKPKMKVDGHLILDTNGLPTDLRFTAEPVSESQENRGENKRYLYSYKIGASCKTDEVSGAIIFPNLYPNAVSSTQGIVTSLRVSPERNMYLIRIEDPPAPWNKNYTFTAINVKNAQGYVDWPVLPPIQSCEEIPAAAKSTAKDCKPQHFFYPVEAV